ncbi:TIGR02466 family protein [Thalassospiraceae bacterium LMO-JJ14]|nr:TIGR02466 family protein [Thalassospiraceae bacterium LMO-JJ14]
MDNVERSIEAFFPLPIHFAQYKNPEKFNEKLTQACHAIRDKTPNSLPEASSNDHYSTLWSGFSLLDQPGFEDLRAFIVQEANLYADFLRFDTKTHPLKLTDSWVNIHGHGHSQEPHVHPNNFISGVYYVAKPENSGDFLLHSPFKLQMLQAPALETTPYTARTFPVKGSAGLLVLFQSFTEHSVQANKSNGERISISFNFTM